MKTNRLISIALVTVMALTVVSGAGVITAHAVTQYVPPVLSPMVVTQDGAVVDPSALQVGKEATVQWTYTWQDLALVQQGSAYILFTQVSIPDGSTAWPLKSANVIDQNSNGWFNVGDGYAMRLTFTPDKEGTYEYHVTLHAEIVGLGQTLDTVVSLVAHSPSAVTEESVIGEVNALITTLNGDTLYFQTQKQERVFVNKLNGLIAVIDAGDVDNYGYAEALAKVSNDLTKYNTKWGVSGTTVADALATITAHLEELQGVPG